MVIFHSYVKLPEANPSVSSNMACGKIRHFHDLPSKLVMFDDTRGYHPGPSTINEAELLLSKIFGFRFWVDLFNTQKFLRPSKRSNQIPSEKIRVLSSLVGGAITLLKNDGQLVNGFRMTSHKNEMECLKFHGLKPPTSMYIYIYQHACWVI